MTDERPPQLFKSLAATAAPLFTAGSPIPLPLRWALDGDPRPLALSTRVAWPEWALANGYDETQIAILNQCIRRIVVSTSYLNAMALDLSERLDVECNAIEPLARFDRHAGALTAYVRNLPNPSAPKPAPPGVKIKGTLSLPATR